MLGGSDSSEDSEEDARTWAPQVLLPAGEASDSDEEAEEAEGRSAPVRARAAAPEPPSLAPAAAPKEAGSSREAAALPSASDALESDLQETAGFLHVDGPEFDASKGFKPPPVSARDLAPVHGSERSSMNKFEGVPPPRGWQGDARFERASEQQSHASDLNHWGRPAGATRLHGSVCYENDDERGRRVKYGAHSALAADPWSACNPNFSMKDSSITRGKDRGRKRATKRFNPCE